VKWQKKSILLKKILKHVPESSRRNQHTQSSSYRLLSAVENQPANERKSHKQTNKKTSEEMPCIKELGIKI